MKLKDRILLLGLSCILVGGFVYSQIYIHNRNRKELLDIAREIAFNWKEKLGLNPEQTSELVEIIIKFTIFKNEIINSDNPESEKIAKLQKIQSREHKNLLKILSESQFENYIGINKKIPNKIMDSQSV
ncbi:hypothetical protein [Gillisia limnaea]|uniref:Secreted protein n=1 Tax=Gillisia limnaea (strain DSM 15749 / LMG 21470 / R-8282) TaxID=865937 RepID=H2BQY9_GILLR|nr:hypothetical protein [Gillisia limnaea]EHQ04308.1 secreted protein [Gillisia limnaea DSM 15749]